MLLGFLDKLFKKKIEGKTVEEWYGLAVGETDPEKKIEYFDKVLVLKPDFAGAWNLRGLEFVVLKRYEEAIASFDKALEIRPGYPEARYNKEDVETELRKIRITESPVEGEKEGSTDTHEEKEEETKIEGEES
ncbi:tetratricopeptide repeat protein [Methanosarcina sp. 1.H.A.2.2]|uniref:tetratricopeptide repeat protein n=1 Tax=Methanosarcina sp. 1.H.A.2.2 TaxID=1483601 RepID=UPI00064F8192|nr:tetratricopeptide repeat protein [Methanosarcina sp. 1.H.A.2.2]